MHYEQNVKQDNSCYSPHWEINFPYFFFLEIYKSGNQCLQKYELFSPACNSFYTIVGNKKITHRYIFGDTATVYCVTLLCEIFVLIMFFISCESQTCYL